MYIYTYLHKHKYIHIYVYAHREYHMESEEYQELLQHASLWQTNSRFPQSIWLFCFRMVAWSFSSRWKGNGSSIHTSICDPQSYHAKFEFPIPINCHILHIVHAQCSIITRRTENKHEHPVFQSSQGTEVSTAHTTNPQEHGFFATSSNDYWRSNISQNLLVDHMQQTAKAAKESHVGNTHRSQVTCGCSHRFFGWLHHMCRSLSFWPATCSSPCCFFCCPHCWVILGQRPCESCDCDIGLTASKKVSKTYGKMHSESMSQWCQWFW